MSFLQIDAIHKTYDGAPLLVDVSLGMAEGEILSLLGPSGSGKTTLLRIVAGLETCESGHVLLDGVDVTHRPVHQRSIVLMFQEYALFPHRTVAENVGFGLRMRKMARSEIRARVRDMLDLVGLSGLEDRSVVQLSGGERQRVALARSLAPEPKLLLLDEPLGSLDRNLRERLLEDLETILRQVGVTTIVVTHDQTEAFALADRVAVLHDAGVVQVGLPREIYRRPASPWVARFLGLTNLLPAVQSGPDRVDTSIGTLMLDSDSCGLPSELRERPARGTVLVPPWSIRLHGPMGQPNVLPAIVTQVVFQGRTTKLSLRARDETLTASLGALDRVPQVGDAVQILLDPRAVCWFQSEWGLSSGTAKQTTS